MLKNAKIDENQNLTEKLYICMIIHEFYILGLILDAETSL